MSQFIKFNRKEWADLRKSVPLSLTEQDLEPLLGINENISLSEVSYVFLPLVRLINYSIQNYINHQNLIQKFLGIQYKRVPYIIGIAGSVAAGKSTTARILQALLQKWPYERPVDLITTDGFLYDLDTLSKKGLLNKKGFPISYNVKLLIKYLSDIKSNKKNVKSPIYSQQSYDILKDQYDMVHSPEILILEGLNVLQKNKETRNKVLSNTFVSDFLDFSIFVHAEEELLKDWYLQRFLYFKHTAFIKPDSYFHHFSKMSDKQALKEALKFWDTINGKNLRENILPTKKRAKLILEKGKNHLVQCVKLKK